MARSVEPDPRLARFAGSDVDWRYAAQKQVRGSASAVAWSRATFQGASSLMRIFLIAGWTALLLEGRARSDAEHVLGWPIAQEAPDTVVLQRRSRLGIHATLVFTTGPDTVTFSSAMVYASALGRIVWAVVAPLHRWGRRRHAGARPRRVGPA